MIEFRDQLIELKESNAPAVKVSSKPDVVLSSSLDVARSKIRITTSFYMPIMGDYIEISSIYIELLDELVRSGRDPEDLSGYKDVFGEMRDKYKD